MDPPRPHPDWPLVVAYGLGVNSTAMLVEFAKRGIRPDLILFADTGGEKPETYRYMPVIQAYLKEVKFPPVVTVRYEPKTAPYRTLEGQCLHTGTLPSLAYGGQVVFAQVEAAAPGQDTSSRHFPPGRVRRTGQAGRAGDRLRRRRRAAHVRRGGEGDRTRRGRAAPADVGEAEAGRRDGREEPSREAWLDAQLLRVLVPALSTGAWTGRRASESIRDAGLPVPLKTPAGSARRRRRTRSSGSASTTRNSWSGALAIEANAQPNLTSVVGLGRSFAWADFLDDLDDTPLFPCCA